MTRSQRVDRSYKLMLATGGFGVAGLVFLFAISGLIGILLLVAAAVCGYLLKQTLNP